MPEFLTNVVSIGAVSPLEVAGRLSLALVLGRVVAYVYEWTRSVSERTPSFPATLVLLTVLIAMVTQVIGDSVARAFSLVGALSIVRFRTVVRDTEDTAFVIFAVITGMAIGGSDFRVALIGIVIVWIGAWWMRPAVNHKNGETGSPFVLKIRVALGSDLNTLVVPTLRQKTDYRLLSLGTAKQGTAINASYAVQLGNGVAAAELVNALNQIDGVHSVELAAPEEAAEDI
jgi:hypothetical protein